MISGLTHLAGWLAIGLLVTSLALSLVARAQLAWTREHRARLLSSRRLAGLGSAGAALLHLVLGLSLLAPATLEDALAMISGVPYLRHGALALALLGALALTSFPKLNARLGLRTWSTLHRAVYVASVLATLHVLAGPSAEPRLAASTAFVMALLLLARVWPVRSEGAGRARPEQDVEPVTRESADNP